jgi:hypothetical protein
LWRQHLETGVGIIQETVRVFARNRQDRQTQSTADLIQENARLRFEVRRMHLKNEALARENEAITRKLEAIDDECQNSEEYWTRVLR